MFAFGSTVNDNFSKVACDLDLLVDLNTEDPIKK